MLPPALMLAIKKRAVGSLVLPAWLLICGCAPPGPRALLKGERLIRDGKYEQAIESLTTATRLLPKSAQAYNHLGLALHGNKQYAPALVNYQKALALDHKLAAAHYNIGCLCLEQNDPQAAIEHLTSYTLLQPNSADGWLKLGNAQVRAHKPDAAEKALKTALAQHPRDPEVLNGLGVIQLQRKRPQDALNYFNFALSQNPNYSPALLNASIVSHQYLNNRQSALEKYRQYLALQPRTTNWEAVSAIASQLDSELNPPPPPRLAQIKPAPPTVGKTNLSATLTNPPRVASNHPVIVAASTNVRTNLSVSAPSPPKMAAQTNQGNTNPFVIAGAKPPLPETNRLPPAPFKPQIEVTQVPDELVIKPPQEIAAVRPPVLPATIAPETPAASSTNAATGPDKRGILSRLNPFGGKPKSTAKETGSIPIPDAFKPSPVVVAARETNLLIATTSTPPPPPLPRYTYVSPGKPAAGNRPEAQRFFAEGVKAQQAGRPAQAVAAYRRATQLDPAYFEAYYNQGLAAYGMTNWKESLVDFEYALALKPNSADTRYNFALTLQQANYPQDAADELLDVLNDSPGETRAHLLLANLYAKQLNQPKLARQHYLKVLQDDPRHPKAAEIRYWLAANP